MSDIDEPEGKPLRNSVNHLSGQKAQLQIRNWLLGISLSQQKRGEQQRPGNGQDSHQFCRLSRMIKDIIMRENDSENEQVSNLLSILDTCLCVARSGVLLKRYLRKVALHSPGHRVGTACSLIKRATGGRTHIQGTDNPPDRHSAAGLRDSPWCEVETGQIVTP